MAFLTIVVLGGIIFVFIVLFILLFIGTFVLQIFLSKTKNPWAGLIFPGITFIIVLLLCLMTLDFYTAFIIFIRGNIPTAVYLIIYFICRKREKKSDLISQVKT